MSLRSSGCRLFSHSRSGSPPDSVRKKIAGTRLPCVPSASGGAGSAAEASFRFAATHGVYHIRYNHAESKEPRSVTTVRSWEPTSLNLCLPRTERSGVRDRTSSKKWLRSHGVGEETIGPPKSQSVQCPSPSAPASGGGTFRLTTNLTRNRTQARA